MPEKHDIDAHHDDYQRKHVKRNRGLSPHGFILGVRGSLPNSGAAVVLPPVPKALGSGESAFESRAVVGLAMGRQNELDGLVEERPQPGRDLLDRDPFR